MKFLSAASMATLYGLLLSATAHAADPYFECSMRTAISFSGILRCEKRHCYQDAEPGDPEGPNGEIYSAYRFTKVRTDGSEVLILIQSTNEYPLCRVFEKTAQGWQPCTFDKA
ncbi:putative candidate secreted effector protein [Blumeria hordei DH14]|uniref:Putative candidate secreted effector protein n=1 Tax=Blumeria graminis f. sp. hordei (strain DH14) TaxID=546991 RepID=N1J708_BLUG1|nr:putative candidate secreted effector protein [Blumeria hordei DH14]